MQVKKKVYRMFDGTRKRLVSQVGDGSIICRFDKTPQPSKSTDVVCPHFLELKWATGCQYNCAWCFLQGTLRFIGKSPRIKNWYKIEQHVQTFLNNSSSPEILNSGELADALLSESDEKPFSKFIIPMFENQNKHKILILTKSNNIKNLLDIDRHNNVIVSFSLNAKTVADKWEHAPKVESRIEAARKLNDAGYTVRVRIDPIVPVFNWDKHYIELVDSLFENLIPERITLGSLRGLQSTINNSKDKSWVNFLSEKSNWGKKVDFNTRYEIYSSIINYLKEKYNYDRVALCKETIEMWDKLKLNYKNIKCNCIL
ncbi:MAG: radical SAM protein [Candidatus Methanoperedens sp.]